MSTYSLQQYLFDQLGAWSTDRSTLLDPAPYALTADEATAVQADDIATLYGLGVHPVLLNAWCRATGHTRDEYRALLAPFQRPPGRKAPRWQSSA